MKKFLILFVALALSVSPAFAEHLTLTGQDLSWNPADPSPVFTVGVENSDGTTDRMLAWSLGLEIVPTGGAVGNVQFAQFITPASPGSYLLDGDSAGVFTLASFPSTSIAPIGDNTNSATGVAIPATGKFLLQVNFLASSDALGTFDIFVHADEFTGAYWNGLTLETESFLNVLLPSGSTKIGQVTVVPEPATWLIAGQSVLVGAFWVRRLRARRFAA